MTGRRRLSLAAGAAVLIFTVFVVPYVGTYTAATNATHAYTRSTQNSQQLAAVQKLLSGMNTLLGFVAASQTKAGRANSIFFALQMQDICRATPGCKVEPLPAALRP